MTQALRAGVFRRLIRRARAAREGLRAHRPPRVGSPSRPEGAARGRGISSTRPLCRPRVPRASPPGGDTDRSSVRPRNHALTRPSGAGARPFVFQGLRRSPRWSACSMLWSPSGPSLLWGPRGPGACRRKARGRRRKDASGASCSAGHGGRVRNVLKALAGAVAPERTTIIPFSDRFGRRRAGGRDLGPRATADPWGSMITRRRRS